MREILEEINLPAQWRKLVWATCFILVSSAIVIGLINAFQDSGLKGNDFPQGEREWEALLEKKDTIHLHWLRTLNPFIRKTQGDLIWNAPQQKGVMHFVNLPRLKGEQRYHLWIYDLHKPLEKPVIAGVFSINNTTKSESYVPFKPKEVVDIPYKFLLTLGKKDDLNFSRLQSLLLAQP